MCYFFKMADNDSSSITRGNSRKLYRPRLNKGIYKDHFYSIRIVNSCNKLPEEVISAKTVNCFKNRLDKHSSSRHVAQEALPIIPPLALR